jgi:hypothetical protein
MLWRWSLFAAHTTADLEEVGLEEAGLEETAPLRAFI